MSFHWKRKELLKYLQLLFSSNKQRLEKAKRNSTETSEDL